MQTIITFLKSKYLVWTLILLLALEPLLQLFDYPFSLRDFNALMHESGESAIRLLILALLVSPLRLIFPNSRAVHWLGRNRRYFGVGAFCLAFIHVTAYVLNEHLSGVIAELTQPRIVAGWIAFILFIPLAATSTNWAVKKLGGVRWKQLHRAVYVAAVAAALHWLLLKDGEGVGPTLVHFTPLALLEIYRVIYWVRKKRQIAAPSQK